MVTISGSAGSGFAAIRPDYSVITWGHPSYGGDSSSVEQDLDGTPTVDRIIPIKNQGFVAIRSDGSNIYWGAGRLEF